LTIATGGLLALYLLATTVSSARPGMERYMEQAGAQGPPLFFALYVLLTPLFVPATLFSITAGTLFGIVQGTAVVCVSSVTSSSIMFFLGRNLFRERVRRSLQHRQRLRTIYLAAERRSLRLMFLVRLSPLSFTLQNYMFGASQVPYRDFLAA